MTVMTEWPTLLAGISAFIAIKFAILLAAGDFALGLTRAESVRVALLLAGGGEFAFVVFKLAKDLNVLPEELAKLLTASVIISMSLTPLLGEIAEVAGNALEQQETRKNGLVTAGPNGSWGNGDDYDVNLTDEQRIRDAFEMFDEDGSGAISVAELQKVLTKPGTVDTMMTTEEVRAAISRFDVNGDEELQFDEFSALWMAKRRKATGSSGTSADGNVSPELSNAVVVCGYGEVGQLLCKALEGTAYVAFSQNPTRISEGVMNGAKVVFGNGASPSLIRAAGIENPSAFCVVYESESRSLEATIRLRDAFPTTPIYSRAQRQESLAPLKEAGATEVVVQTAKAAESLSLLAGRSDVMMTRMMEAAQLARGKRNEVTYVQSDLEDLAAECGMRRETLLELYELFSTSLERNEKGQVQLAELRNELMRRRTQPMDDKTLSEWMGYDESLSKWVTGKAETTWVTFPDFVRFAAGKVEIDD